MLGRLRFSILSQALHEARRPMIIWSAVMAAALVLILVAHPLLRTLLGEPLPEWMAILLGVPQQGAGLAEARVWWMAASFNLVLPLLMTIYAARHGSLLMSSEEERGSLGFLLATPLPRSQLILEKFAALLLLLLAPAAVVWLAGALTGFFDPRPALGLFLLGLAFGAPAFSIAAVTGRHLLSQNASLLAALLTLLFDRFANQFTAPALRLISPFSYYGAIRLGGGLLAFGPAMVLLGLSLLAFFIGWMVFNRRDLHI